MIASSIKTCNLQSLEFRNQNLTYSIMLNQQKPSYLKPHAPDLGKPSVLVAQVKNCQSSDFVISHVKEPFFLLFTIVYRG